jgi:SAM-dependent methyltransferase
MKRRYEKYNRFQSQLDLPFLETPEKSLIEIFSMLEIKFRLTKDSKQKFVDLGSGNGQVVIFAAINYHIKSMGVEINQELIKETKERIKKLKKEKIGQKKNVAKIKLLNGSFYGIKLYPFDFIYIYSLPTMQKFLKHVFMTVKTDSIVISYKYPLENFEETLSLEHVLEKGEGEHKFIAFFYKKL